MRRFLAARGRAAPRVCSLSCWASRAGARSQRRRGTIRATLRAGRSGATRAAPSSSPTPGSSTTGPPRTGTSPSSRSSAKGFPTPPKIVKADELELEVYWHAPNLSKQRIVGRRDTLLLPTDIAYHRDHLGIVQNNFPQHHSHRRRRRSARRAASAVAGRTPRVRLRAHRQLRDRRGRAAHPRLRDQGPAEGRPQAARRRRASTSIRRADRSCA